MVKRCINRPLWWFVAGGFLFLAGVALTIVAALSNSTLYNSVVTGVYNARFIDNTKTTSGCSTMILGDSTCPGMRYQGWAMTAEDKYNLCMADSEPSSKALSSASKWCRDGSAGCNKPDSCKQGTKYTYYFFSVVNPDEVLKGYPAEVKEMEPINIRRSFNRTNIDTNQWDETGVAKWTETSRWEIMDESQAHLLDQVVVVPNPLAFVTIPSDSSSSSRLTSENLVYTVAAAKLYTGLQRKISDKLSDYADILVSLFSGPSAIDWRRIVRDSYRDGSPILKLGDIFANRENCQFLMNMIVAGGMLEGNADFFGLMMCTDAYKDNVALAAFSKVFEIGKIKITPDDGILFYEYEKNCRSLGDKPSNVCRKSAICPNGSESCLRPSLSVADVDGLFDLFALVDVDFDANRDKLIKFLDSCDLGTHVLEPKSLCLQVQEQLKKAGHAAVFSANPDNGEIMAAYGWTDRAVAAQMVPYFINGTIGQVMNYQNKGLGYDKLFQKQGGIRQWSTVDESEVNPNLFMRQQMSSAHGHEGLNYYKSAMGMDYSCAFDYNCMSQASFLADGKTCVADELCEPTYANGYDVGAVPGNLYNHPEFSTKRFHQLGAKKSMFVSDMYVGADFRQVENSAEWRDGLLVNKWNLTSVGMKTENCDESAGNSMGLDCRSPAGTINIGYNAMYAAGETPKSGVLPLYASFPHFSKIVEDKARLSYDPLSKLIIHPCDSCPKNRDFGTFLWTEPETGLHVRGSQKIQLNVRLSANPGNVTQFPQPPTGERMVLNSDGSSVIDSAVDVMIPLYWINKFDDAAEWQRNAAYAAQNLPSKFSTMFILCLVFGVLLLIGSLVIIWWAFRLRRRAMVSASRSRLAESVMSEKLAAAEESTDRETTSNQYSTPRATVAGTNGPESSVAV